MYVINTLSIYDLTVEHLSRPIGIDVSSPCFAWKLKSDIPNVMQTSYHIQVYAENGLVLAADTGIVKTDQSIEVQILDWEIVPRTYYTVKITVTDNHGRTAEGETCFETGRMGIPFTGSWIEPIQDPTPSSMDRDAETINAESAYMDGKRDFHEFRPAQYIRIPFQTKKGIRRGRVYATAHGLYRLTVNGTRPDDREFAPENTAYNSLLLYQTYDITSLLQSGENVIGVILADGWWTGRVGTTGDCCQYGDTIALLLEAEVEYMDGTRDTITAEQGVSSTGPIIFSDLFVGEKYDATKEVNGWDCPAFDDSDWKPVQKKEYSKEHLKGQAHAPVRPLRTFTPERIFTAPNGDTILDAGQNLAGNIRFTVTAPEGLTITLEHFEVLGKDGNYFNSILNNNKEQTDIYITREGTQIYQPAFTYHGFRYVRITGWPGEAFVSDFEVCAYSSEMKNIGAFTTSDPRLNQLQNNIWWSQVSNTLSIPTDCPQREKAGWTGDIMAYAPTLCFNRNADAFLTSWMDNVRAEQMPDGAIPMIVPYLKAYATFLRDNLGSDTSCGWGDAVIIVPYSVYRAYGDRRILEENYDAMQRWMNYIDERAKNHHPEDYGHWDDEHKARSRYLWNTDFHFGDWLIPSIVLGNPDANAMNDTAYATMGIVAPAYYAFSARHMSEIAEILGKQEDAAYYHDLYEKIRDAFITEYVHEDGTISTEIVPAPIQSEQSEENTDPNRAHPPEGIMSEGHGTLDADFQGIYVIALYNQLVTNELRPKMVEHLCDLIHKNGERLDTGFLSVPFLMDVLCDNSRADIAYKLLFQTKCPSWLYEIEKGATTMWESWGAIDEDSTVSTYSYNHYAFGCVGDWMYRHLGGLQAAEPGYKKLRIAPHFDSGLTSVSVSEETPYGKASVDWKLLGDKAVVHVEIPANTTAILELPGHESEEIGSGEYDYFQQNFPKNT